MKKNAGLIFRFIAVEIAGDLFITAAFLVLNLSIFKQAVRLRIC